MRVSLPICITSCLLVVLLTWWLSTRSRDFMTPPSEAKLKSIRMAAMQTNPTAQGLGDALTPVDNQDQDTTPIAVVLPKHVSQAPRLDDYREEASYGPEYLMELAKLLSTDHPERALTCWERVLDSSNPNDNQRQRAVREILRLRKQTPAWSEQAGEGVPIVIQAGTGPTAATLLQPVLMEIASLLKSSSSGVVNVEVKVSAGTEDLIEKGNSPVALWISGPDESSASTDVVSFFIPIENPQGLRQQVERETYRIVRHHLSQMDDFQPLPKPSEQYSPDKLLEGHITRMVWNKFAESLRKKP